MEFPKLFSEQTGKPLFVIDRNVLLQRIEKFIPPSAEMVLPDLYFYEASQDKNPNREQKHFNKWAKLHSDRLWLARYWKELSCKEMPGYPCKPMEILHQSGTERLRGEIVGSGLDWQQGPMDEIERDRSSFLELCSQFTNWLCSNHSNEILSWKKHPSSRVEWVCEPSRVVDFVVEDNDRMQSDDWRKHLSQFPDVYAAGRFTRIIVWYMSLHAVGATKDWDNNWEDAHYAFAASYVGRIATRDGNMIKMIRAIFPYVEICDKPKY